MKCADLEFYDILRVCENTVETCVLLYTTSVRRVKKISHWFLELKGKHRDKADHL